MEYLRNKQTGEIREVERDTPEFIVLKNQVGPEGRSLWEQTGDHHVGRLAAAAETSSLVEEDLGAEDQQRLQTVARTEVARPPHQPWKDLTAAEREAGLDEDSKEQELQDELNSAAIEENAGVLSEAADKIAGGTPDGFPVDEVEDDGGSGRSGGSGSGEATKADLQEQARERGLSTSGTKAEIQARLDADDADNGGDSNDDDDQ